MTRVAIYARCSTSEQDFTRQLEELRRSAESRGWGVVSTFGSYVSGASNDSDLNLIRAEASRRRFDVLMVWELSRLSRRGSASILALMTQFEQWGVRIYSHAEPWINADGPQRELLLALFGWIARLERDMISARTRSAMASRRALGKHMGRPKGSKDGRPRKVRAKGGPLAPYLAEPSLDKGPLIGGGAT